MPINLRHHARYVAVRRGHRLSLWRTVPVPDGTLTQTCVCLNCGATVVWRDRETRFHRAITGSGLTDLCPVAAQTAPASRPDIHQWVMMHNPQFRAFMARLHGENWETALSFSDKRTAAKRWMHALNYGMKI